MSRSYRKTPICGITTARTEKQDKRIANRRYRRNVQQSLFREEEALPLVREISNIWCMGKDGKYWWGWVGNPGNPRSMWNRRKLMSK